MQEEVKKTMAREFLIILSCVLISFLPYLIIKPINYFKQNQVNKLINDSIQKKIIEIDEYNKNVSYNNERARKEKEEQERLRLILGSNYAESIGGIAWRPLLSFENEDRESISNYYTFKEMISDEKIIKISKILIILMVCIFFLLRYLYYATRWSLKTLRQGK
jgi:hypothetical protein